jgi:hypothetical protein
MCNTCSTERERDSRGEQKGYKCRKDDSMRMWREGRNSGIPGQTYKNKHRGHEKEEESKVMNRFRGERERELQTRTNGMWE